MLKVTRPAITMDGETWVELSRSRTRAVFQRAESETHAKRLQAGLTQCALAKKLGCSQSKYSKMEAGLLAPTAKELAAIDKICRV